MPVDGSLKEVVTASRSNFRLHEGIVRIRGKNLPVTKQTFFN